MGGLPGGDWYDVVALGEGQVAVAMGDVVGQGAQAAAVMADLRQALRSCAGERDPSPATVIGQLNHEALASGLGEMTTLVYIVVSTRLGTARLTNAGHCPPLLLGPDGEARFLEDGLSCPLGVVEVDEQPEVSVTFDPGMTLVLYTDGLVESRTRPLGDGLRQLRRATANGPKEPDALCHHLLEVLRQGEVQQDDIALLAVRFDPPG
jgi:serine phosphatase RsbU (regulator of sigma subunit)